jgi:hypothetical protein
MQWTIVGVVGVLTSVVVVFVVGCSGDGSPPYEDLLVRDALRAEPKIVSVVPSTDRRTLADRMERERSAGHPAQRVTLDPRKLSAAEVVTRIDDERAASDADAWVTTLVRSGEGSVEARALIGREAGAPNRATALPPIEGEPARPDTRDLEAKALAGRAGDLLADLLEQAHAVRLVRVVQWPVGAVAIGDTVYVNAAWLVAMAALEDDDAGPPPRAARGITGVSGSELTPTTLRGNPYATFRTLESCVADVTSRCDACLRDGACDGSATLSDFPDGRTECDFLARDTRRAAQLCALALTSIETIAECVKKDGCIPPTGATTSTSLAAADPFLAKDACIRSLNLCLSGTNEPLDAGADRALVDVRVEGCQNPFSACSSSFAGCSKACDTGKCNSRSGPSCSSCNGCNGGCTKCSGCSKESRTGSGTGYGSTGTGQNPGTGSSSSSSSSGGTSGSSSSSSGSSGGTSGSGSSSSGSSGSASSSSGGSASSSSGGSSSSASSSSSSSGGSSGGSSSGGSCNNCNS